MFIKQYIAYEPGYLTSGINMIKRGRHAFVDESFGVFGFVDGVVGYSVVTSYS